MPLIRIAPKVGKRAPTGPLPLQHPQPQRPEQLAAQKEIDGQDQPQGQPRQLQPQGPGQDHRGQDRQAQGQDAAGQGQDQDQGQEQGAGTEAKESTTQEDDDFLSRFLPFGVGGGGGPEPRDLSLEPAETDPGEGDGPGPGPGGDGGAVGTSGQVTGSLWDVADVDTGPMGQPIGNEVEPAKSKPVTAEDTDSALASFAGQELGRRSGQVRRRRTGSVIPRPHLPSVALRPEPPAPVVPDWFVRRIRPPKLPRPRRP